MADIRGAHDGRGASEEGAGPAPTIVAGFDRRPESRAALRAGAGLAARLGATMVVVHALDIADYPVDPDAGEWDDRARRALNEERQEVQATLAGLGVNWSFRACSGDPAHALMEVADETDATMIVVGTRGEGWGRVLDRLASPSVAHRLINRCGRPVLVVSHVRERAGT